MTENIKRWFIEKVAQNPEFLGDKFLPALERLETKAQSALDQAIRNDGIEKIKYQMGWLDGVREIQALLNGLKMAEGKIPVEPGLMARILASVT